MAMLHKLTGVESPAVSPDMAPVVPVIALQDSEGATEDNLTIDVAINIESWMVATALGKSKIAYKARGGDPSRFNPRHVSDSQVLKIGNKRLAVVKMTAYPDQYDSSIALRAVRVFGFTGQGMVTVSCIRNSNHDIPIWNGPCGEKIREAFVVSIQP